MAYEDDVKEFIRTDSPKIFGNYSKEHAACVVRNLLESAKESVELVTGSFPDDFYTGKVKDAFDVAVSRSLPRKVRVITLSGERSPSLIKMEAQHPGSLEYRPARWTGQGNATHFMVIDNKRYRLEEPHPDELSEGDNVKAEICCNGPKKAEELRSFFDLVWNNLAPKSTDNSKRELALKND